MFLHTHTHDLKIDSMPDSTNIQLRAASPATVPVQHARRLSFEGAPEAALARDERHDDDDDDEEEEEDDEDDHDDSDDDDNEDEDGQDEESDKRSDEEGQQDNEYG